MIRPCFISTVGASNFNSNYRHEVYSMLFPNSILIPPHYRLQSIINHHASLLNTLSQLDTTSVLPSTITTLPSIVTSVKVFDGSQIANEVVVSNNFWSTLVSKLPYIIAAELLAAVIFIAIVSIVTSQSKLILDQVSNNDNDIQSTSRQGINNQFRKANDPPPRQLDFTKLFLCICIDILGSVNEAIPLVGELVDVIYAPIAALLLRQLFSGSNIIALLEFTEEVLPFTDILPLATICWICEAFFGNSSLARVLRIGEFAPDRENTGNFIDIETYTEAEDRGQFRLPNDQDNIKR